MAIITRSVNNPRNIPCPLRIPGYDATLPIISVAPSQTLDLLTVITEDNLIAAQETLDILIAGGALTVTATFDTATLEQGYDGGSGTGLVGVINNDTTKLTTSWNFLNFQNASNSEIFFKDVIGTTINGHVGWDTANTYIDSSTGIQFLVNEFGMSPHTWLLAQNGNLTTAGDIDMTNHVISNVRLANSSLSNGLDGQNQTITNVGLNGAKLDNDLDAQTFRVVNLSDPALAQDASTKNYVDTNFLSLSGGTLSGNLLFSSGNEGLGVAASAIFQDLTYTARGVGLEGNLLFVAYTTGGTAGSEIVSVDGNTITVQIESGVSTSTQVKNAIDGSMATSLVSVVNNDITGTNPQTAPDSSSLSGGMIDLSNSPQAIYTGKLEANDLVASTISGLDTLVLGSVNTYGHVRYEPALPISSMHPAWEAGFRQGNPYYSIVMDDGSTKTTFVDFALNNIAAFSVVISANSSLRTTSIGTISGDSVIDLTVSGVSAYINTPADQVQLQVQGNSTQTSNLVEVLKSDNTPFLTINNSGLTTLGGNLDLVQHQLVNAVIQTGTSEPGSPVEGQIFYRSDTHQFEGWNGSSWVLLG